MSVQDAKTFLDQLDNDPELQEDVKNAVMAEDRIVYIGRKKKLYFTVQELDQALHNKWGNTTLSNISARVTFSQAPGF